MTVLRFASAIVLIVRRHAKASVVWCAALGGFYALGFVVAPLIPQLRVAVCMEHGVLSLRVTGSPGRS